MFDRLNTDPKVHASSSHVDTCAIGHVSQGKHAGHDGHDIRSSLQMSLNMTSAHDGPGRLIRSGIRVVVKIRSIPNNFSLITPNYSFHWVSLINLIIPF